MSSFLEVEKVPVEDSSPERRNLVVSSMGFIAYYYGHGFFRENEISIQAINLHFKSPVIIGVMAWAAFFWFLLRYWQVTRGLYMRQFKLELNEFKDYGFVIAYVEKSLNMESERDGGFRLYAPHFDGWVMKIPYAIISNPHYGVDGEIVGFIPAEDGEVPLVGFNGALLSSRIVATCILKHRSFTEYAVPYILAYVALLGAALRAAM